MISDVNKSICFFAVIAIASLATTSGCSSSRRSVQSSFRLTFGPMEDDCEVPFVVDGMYRPIVSLRVNGVEGKFLLDTGCNYIVLTDRCIAMCGIAIKDGAVTTASLGNGQEWTFDKISRDFTLEMGLSAIRCDGFPVISDEGSDHFGTLGCAFMAVYGGQIDFNGKTIYFKKRPMITELAAGQ